MQLNYFLQWHQSRRPEDGLPREEGIGRGDLLLAWAVALQEEVADVCGEVVDAALELTVDSGLDLRVDATELTPQVCAAALYAVLKAHRAFPGGGGGGGGGGVWLVSG